MYEVGRKIGWREGAIENGAARDWYCNGEILEVGKERVEGFEEGGVVVETMTVQSFRVRDEKTGEVKWIDDWQIDEYRGKENPFMPGDYVTYRTDYKTEPGRVKSCPDAEHCFVVYSCAGEWDRYQDYTAARTRVADLERGWTP
jgi:hypothetical protein